MDRNKKLYHYAIYITLSLSVIIFLFYISRYNYLIPHTFIELAGAVLSVTIFSIGWNTRKFSKNHYMTILAVGYLIVGILTVFHTLSYKGMAIFPGLEINEPSQFWIATRYIESITIYLATLSLNRKKEVNSNIIFTISMITCFVIVASIFMGLFPDCFLYDTGLTSFKIISEYLISAIIILTMHKLVKYRNKFNSEIYRLMHASLCFKIVSEIHFTLYTEPYGFANLIGHFFLLLSICLMYVALVQGNLTRPYESLFRDTAIYAEELAYKNEELEIKDKAIASTLNAIVLTDLTGRINYVNDAFLSLLGYEEEEVLGQSLLDYFDLSFSNDIALQRFEAMGGWYGEIMITRRDGSLMHSLLTANYIYSKQDEKICCMASFLDITDRKEMEEDLRRAKNEAEAANIAKSQFLANMSHEIRTPMNGILGFLQLLELTSVTKQQEDYIAKINTSAETLLTIINDILDVTKIESGKMELEEIPFDLYMTIHNAVNPIAINAFDKEIDFHVFIKPEVPRSVIGDPTRLSQIIINLAGNAIKFTHEGYVLLEVRLKERQEPFVIIEIKVKDSGIGIAADSIKSLFEPFTQADASLNRRYGGTGLGLTISRSLVHRMGGDIWVESEEGKGSEFTFTIRMQEEMNNMPCKNTDFSELKGKHILIVDNQCLNQYIAKTYLQEVGCMITEAFSIVEALGKLMEEFDVYNLVIINHRLLNESNLDMLMNLKNLPIAKDIPFALLTTITSNIVQKSIINQIFTAKIWKPFKRYELFENVLNAMTINRDRDTNEETLYQKKARAEKDHELQVLIVEDNDINLSFFKELMKDTNVECDIATNGEEAVKACLCKDYDLIFMDCQMPVMDGFEATRQIRAAEEGAKHTTIIAMTAYAMKGDSEKCIESGMDDYISKPIDYKKVLSLIEEVKNKH